MVCTHRQYSLFHVVFISILFIVFGCFVYLFWIFKMSSSSSVKYSLEISLLIFERWNLHYYGIIIILVENGLKTAILLLIAIISGTIYCPAKFVIVTGLLVRHS